ncbi:hypothetical protein, partial [Achromobacter xylosoxidans]
MIVLGGGFFLLLLLGFGVFLASSLIFVGRPSGGRTRWRATSMRPTESEGVAEGEDEDEDGAVRS